MGLLDADPMPMPLVLTFVSTHVSARLHLGAPTALPGQITLAEAERAHILQTLERFGRNHSGAAEAPDIGRTTLWRKLKEYGIER